MILLDKSEYDKVAEELAAEGFFRSFEEKCKAAMETSPVQDDLSAGPLSSEDKEG